jgi:hypothetical protein
LKNRKMRTWAVSDMALLLALDLTSGSKAAAIASDTLADQAGRSCCVGKPIYSRGCIRNSIINLRTFCRSFT